MCGNKRKGGLCPISFGLALGITCALAMFLFSLWAMYRGMPAVAIGNVAVVVPITWGDTGIFVGLGFLKGFIFGLILALIYDLILCCCKRCKGCCKCCNNTSCNCNDCACCKPDIKQ